MEWPEPLPVAAWLERLCKRGEPWGRVLGTRVMVAINQELAGLDALILEGDAVALFPPVTGA